MQKNTGTERLDSGNPRTNPVHETPGSSASVRAGPQNEIAGPAGTGTGDEHTKADELRRKPYNHPERVAIRQATAARERQLRALLSVDRLWRACAAFDALTGPEQRAFAELLVGALSAGEPISAFGRIQDEAADWARFASRDELRAYLAAIVVRISSNERRKLAKALGKAAA